MLPCSSYFTGYKNGSTTQEEEEKEEDEEEERSFEE